MSGAAAPRVDTRYYQLHDYNLGMAITFIVVDSIAVALRIWSRKRQGLELKLDDWFIFPALVLTIGAAAAMIHGKSYDTGIRVHDYLTEESDQTSRDGLSDPSTRIPVARRPERKS